VEREVWCCGRPGRFDQESATRVGAVAWGPHRGRCRPLPPLVPADFGSGRFLANLSTVTVISLSGCSASNCFRFIAGSLTLVRFPPPLWKSRQVPSASPFLVFARKSA